MNVDEAKSKKSGSSFQGYIFIFVIFVILVVMILDSNLNVSQSFNFILKRFLYIF